MVARTEKDVDGLRAIGRVVDLTLAEMARAARPGVTTADLDGVCARVLASHGAKSTPKRVYGFPGACCISVNDEVVHGVPGERVIGAGDIVKLDLTADLGGYVADAARVVLVPPAAQVCERLAECVRSAFEQAARVATTGNRLRDIGRAVEKEVKRFGFSVVRELTGHGVGRSVHEPPTVLNFYDRSFDQPLEEGLVITIEPIISAGSGEVGKRGDGWTIATADGSLAAHYEETIIVTKTRPIVVTAAGAAQPPPGEGAGST
jgi:methionyl aminopeptidase